MNVEGRLSELIGEAAGRLHTARSRNDQVATDFRRGCAIPSTCSISRLPAISVRWPRKHWNMRHGDAWTHAYADGTARELLGHHLLAYVEMAARDRGRFADARKR